MTLKDAIRAARSNHGHIYTTDELWQDDENCILIDSLGNLVFGNGEIVTDEEELPQIGWYDATDIEEAADQEDWQRPNTYRHQDVLWDEDDEF